MVKPAAGVADVCGAFGVSGGVHSVDGFGMFGGAFPGGGCALPSPSGGALKDFGFGSGCWPGCC